MPLPIWVRTDKWAPATDGGGSSGFSVECPATGELGHAKPRFFVPEVLASLLADDLGMPVPEVRLGVCDDVTLGVSKLWGGKSLDVPKIQQLFPEEYASDAFKAGARKASRLLAFHAWVKTGDLKDAHVMVRGVQPHTYELASIDFADAFRWDASGGPVGVPGGPPVLIANAHRDPGVIGEAIGRIESVPDARIAQIVDSVPDDNLARTEKDRIASGLVLRRPKIREAFIAAEWI